MKYKEHKDHQFIYVLGCPSNPLGVMNRLMACGGVVGEDFKSIELANPHHVFYIDFHDNNKIVYMEDDTMLWESLKKVWKELPPLNDIEKFPESWEEAVDSFYEARSYEDDDNSVLKDDLYELGKIIILRDIYRRGWEPSDDGTPCWAVGVHNGELDVRKVTGWSRLLSFAEDSQANMFLNTFSKSIENVKQYI